jgi:translocation and assembly module TamB
MRRALKISAWALGGLALLILVLGGVLLVAGNSDAGRALIERLTQRLTSGHVSLAGLTGSFPQALFIERLQLSDDRGVWLTAQRVNLEWSPSALLARRLQIDALHAATVDMERLPASSPNAPSGTVSIPRIDVAGLTVDELKLGAALAGTPATLILHGNAHLRSVRDMIIDATAHRIGGDGDYQVQLRFDPQRMDAAVNLHEPAGGPLENLLRLPGLGALAATLHLTGPRAAEHLELSVDAGALHGRAQGTFNLDDLSADLDFAFDSPALAPRPDLAWERASVHGHWHGGVKAPHADGHIEIAQLQLPQAARLAALDADFKADSGRAALHLSASGLRIPGPQPRLLEDYPVTLDASVRLDEASRPLDLSASHRLFTLHATAEATALIAGRRSLALDLTLPNLTDLAALAGQNVHGSALLKAQLQDDGAATHLTLDGNAALRAGTEVWSGAVGEHAALQLSGTFTQSSATLDNMKFSGRAMSLTASGSVSRAAAAQDSVLHARWDLYASDLGAVSPELAGTLKASGSMDGPLTAFAGEAQLGATLALRGSQNGTLSASLKMRGLPASPSGAIVAQGMLDGGPVQVDVVLERAQGGALHTLVRRADWKSLHVDGDVTVPPVAAQTHGELRFGIGQLADLRDLLGTNVAGSLAGTVVLHSDKAHPHAEVHVDAHDLAAGQFAGNAQLSAEGRTDALTFKLDAQLPNWRGAKADLSAGGSADIDARKITVANALVNYRGQELRLLSAAQIALANGVAVDMFKIGAQHAVFQLEGEISPQLDVRASLRRVEPGLVNVFAPGLLAAGTIEAQAQLKGSLALPTGQVRLTATGLAAADDAALGLPPLDLQATAQLMGDTAQIDARLVAGTVSKLELVGKAPLDADGEWNLKINGSLDVGMINPILEARGQHASGDLVVDATVGGTVAAPQIEGSVNLSKGSVRDYARGLGLTDITAAIVGSEGTLQIKSLTAAAAPGTVTMTGKIGVLQAGVPLDLLIKADNAQPLVSKLVTANLNADLHVSGTALAHLDIAGKVHLNRTLIGVPNSLPPNVAVLDVRRRGKPKAAPERPLVIGLDVAVEAPQEFLVQGRGLDAEMGGELHVGGTTDSPSVTGNFDSIPGRGSLSIAGNRLTITEGRVTFSGAGLQTKIDPMLDFTAQSTASNQTASVHIFGLADAPRFEFTSNTGAPPDVIMAQLMFGKDPSQLTALELAQAGAALVTLSGVGGDGGLNPLVKLQKSLGLDRLTLGSGATTNTATGTENTGASIAAGRYISKRVYVEAKQTTLGTSQLETDVDLTKHLKLQTRLGNGTASVQGATPENDPGSSVGLVYQFEY